MSSIPFKFALPRQGHQAAFQQIGLIGGNDQTRALLEELGEKIKVVGTQHSSASTQTQDVLRNLRQRQDSAANSRRRHGARHPPDDAGRLVLSDDGAP